MELKDYLHYYIHSGIGVYIFPDDTITNGFLAKYKADYPNGVYNPVLTLDNYTKFLNDGYKPLLRRLEDMTEEEMVGLLQSMLPADLEDKPTDEEYILNLFRGDGGNLVNSDVAIGAEYNIRYYDGQVTIKKCGTICAYDETGDEQELVNAPRAYHYLLRQGFDLFGLILAGLAIDAKTVEQ